MLRRTNLSRQEVFSEAAVDPGTCSCPIGSLSYSSTTQARTHARSRTHIHPVSQPAISVLVTHCDHRRANTLGLDYCNALRVGNVQSLFDSISQYNDAPRAADRLRASLTWRRDTWAMRPECPYRLLAAKRVVYWGVSIISTLAPLSFCEPSAFTYLGLCRMRWNVMRRCNAAVSKKIRSRLKTAVSLEMMTQWTVPTNCKSNWTSFLAVRTLVLNEPATIIAAWLLTFSHASNQKSTEPDI